MRIRVDLEGRSVQGGVRELVEGPRELGGGSTGGGSLRAQLGVEVHARYRAQRRNSLRDAFTAEVPVTLRDEVDGFEVNIDGRIDGRIEHADEVALDEVKSVIEDGPADARAKLQLSLYALAVWQQGERRPLRLSVVLVRLRDEAERIEPLPFDPVQTRARLHNLVRRAIDDAHARRRVARARRRWAERLRFPHAEPRPGQLELVDAIESGLVAQRPVLAEAPTGIGKTAAALFASLRFGARDAKRVMYVSPKTTQHAQVAATFSRICDAAQRPEEPADDGPGVAPPLAVTLSARSRVCPPGPEPCTPEACPYREDFDERAEPVLRRLVAEGGHPDPSQLSRLGRRHRLCPHALAVALADRADLVIGDYNYAFDPAVSPHATRELDRTVVVIDEAHNLFDRARGYASAALARTAIEGARDHLDPTDESCDGLLHWLRDAQGAIEAAARRPPDLEDRPALPPGDHYEIAPPHELEPLATRARRILLRYAAAHPELRPDDPIAQVLRQGLALGDAIADLSPALVPYASKASAGCGESIGVVCVDPSERLELRNRGFAGVVGISATLAPLDYFADVLGLSALSPITRHVPSPFGPDQRCVVVAPHVDTTYRQRHRAYDKVARLVADVVATRPGPYLVFFPSFAFLRAVHPRLSLGGEARVLVQAAGATRPERAATLDALRHGEGTRVLLAVTGGVYGEGIDLPGDEVIGAIVIGPSFPPVGFERAAMARHFQVTRAAGFAYAMLYPGLSRVVQAAGRVIRTPEDRGIVVLVGRRFTRPEVLQCLPEDWYRYDPRELLPDDPVEALASFWCHGA